MRLNNSAKKIRNSNEKLSEITKNPDEIKRLFGLHHWNRSALTRRADIWGIVKPLVSEHKEKFKTEDFSPFLENPALSDQDLVDTGTAEAEPLKVLNHPSCCDITLKRVAEIWHRGLARDMDALPSWATTDQIERMYTLYPACKTENETLGYSSFLQHFVGGE